MPTTIFLIKPDAVQRHLVHIVLHLIEVSYFDLVAMRMLLATRDEAEQHYDAHRTKPWFNDLIDFTCSSPMVAVLAEHRNAITGGREVVNIIRERWRNPTDALMRNLVHASDSVEAAEAEARLWFPTLYLRCPRCGGNDISMWTHRGPRARYCMACTYTWEVPDIGTGT